jgi:hypothetical protein
VNERRLLEVALFLIFWGASASILFAQRVVTFGTAKPGSLGGLKGVGVVVELLSPEIEKEGLRTRDVKKDVEIRLRRAGIAVLTEEELLKAPGTPSLSVWLMGSKTGTELYACSIRVELSQAVILERAQSVHAMAPTWNITSFGFVGMNLLRSIRNYLNGPLDSFINAYLAENPKEP